LAGELGAVDRMGRRELTNFNYNLIDVSQQPISTKFTILIINFPCIVQKPVVRYAVQRVPLKHEI
jgi:hypothetical protein